MPKQKTAKQYLEEARKTIALSEGSLIHSDLVATSEKSKFNDGYRPSVTHNKNKDESVWLSSSSYKNKKDALEAAELYLKMIVQGTTDSARKKKMREFEKTKDLL